MDEHELHVSMIGGGIGGLAAASALQRAGTRVTVFERNHELREVGAGLTLWANAVQVLQELGLASEIAAVSAPLTHFECWSWRGKRLGSMPLDRIEKAMGAPNIGIHRADLLRLLVGTLAPGTVQLDAHCVGFTQEEGGVTSHTASGQHHHADVLVGADGLHSVIGAQLLGPRPPRYSGYTCWRGVAPFEDAQVSPGISSETWGRGLRFGMLPIGNGRVFWYATHNCPAGGQDRAGERKPLLHRLFHHWRAPIEQLIEATDEAVILRNDILDRRPVRHWGSGHVTLLGDAAHPPTPNLGQGACQGPGVRTHPRPRLDRCGHAPELDRCVSIFGLQPPQRRLLVGTKDLTGPSLTVEARRSAEVYPSCGPRVPWPETSGTPPTCGVRCRLAGARKEAPSGEG